MSKRITLPVVIFKKNAPTDEIQDTSFSEEELKEKKIRVWHQRKRLSSAEENWCVLCSKISKTDDLIIIAMPMDLLLKRLTDLKIIEASV